MLFSGLTVRQEQVGRERGLRGFAASRGEWGAGRGVDRLNDFYTWLLQGLSIVLCLCKAVCLSGSRAPLEWNTDRSMPRSAPVIWIAACWASSEI